MRMDISKSFLTVPLLLVCASNAYSATLPLNTNVTFIEPLTVTNITEASFGNLSAGVGATVYQLDTSGNVTTVSGPGSYVAGTTSAASFTITGSPTQTINISSGNYIASGGVTPSAATCKYGSLAAIACGTLDNAAGPGGGGTTIYVGLTISADANQIGGAIATPSFTMTISYS